MVTPRAAYLIAPPQHIDGPVRVTDGQVLAVMGKGDRADVPGPVPGVELLAAGRVPNGELVAVPAGQPRAPRIEAEVRMPRPGRSGKPEALGGEGPRQIPERDCVSLRTGQRRAIG